MKYLFKIPLILTAGFLNLSPTTAYHLDFCDEPESSSDKFIYNTKVKKGVVSKNKFVVKTCGWLRDQSTYSRNRLCNQGGNHFDPSLIVTADDACPRTCNDCPSSPSPPSPSPPSPSPPSSGGDEAFSSKSQLMSAVDDYCNDPSGWTDTSGYGRFGDIDDWDVSDIVDMSGLFDGKENCTPDLSKWDVSNVRQFHEMFKGASNFNRDLSDWDVGRGTTFYAMFNGASSFNRDLGDWDVSRGQQFSGMFAGASDFNRNIGNWEMGNARSFWGMFDGATKFDQYIGNWDVSEVTSFESMFKNARNFDRDLSDWDVSSGQNFDNMFDGAVDFDRNICEWGIHANNYPASLHDFCPSPAFCGNCY